jgi:putative glycosyltransferase (TIGR04372 family)
VALLLIGVITLARRWVDLRVVPLNVSRFGHSLHDLDYRLTERDVLQGNPKPWFLVTPARVDLPVASRLVVRIWRTQIHRKTRATWLPASVGVPLVWAVARMGLIPRFVIYNPKTIGGRFHAGSDVYGLTLNYPQNFQLSDNLLTKAKAQALAMGLDPEGEFVCLHVREPGYHSAQANGLWVEPSSFRNGDIQAGSLAATELANLGYQVIRMGVNEQVKFVVADERTIFDYATNGYRSELLDLYLVAKSRFILSNGTGLDAAAQAFRKQIYNFGIVTPQMLQVHRKFQICMRVEEVSTGKVFSLEESFRLPKLTDATLAENRLRLIPNTSEEIAELAIEAAARDRGLWRLSAEQQQLQNRAVAILPSEFRRFTIRAGFGSGFLQRHSDWLNTSAS